MKRGWHKESYRHYLASKGIKTSYYSKKPAKRYFLAQWDPGHEKDKILTRRKNEFYEALGMAKGPGEYRTITSGYVLELDRYRELNLLSKEEFDKLVDEANEVLSEFMEEKVAGTIPESRKERVLERIASKTVEKKKRKKREEGKRQTRAEEKKILEDRMDELNDQLDEAMMDESQKEKSDEIIEELGKLNDRIVELDKEGVK